MKILIAEDNQRLAERIVYKLKDSFTFDTAITGKEVLALTSKIDYSVIILDLGLPDMNGLEVCESIRKSKLDTPILILTGDNEIITKVSLLDAGADDFMNKPFDVKELKARLGALSRRKTLQKADSILSYKDLTLNLQKREATREGKMIALRRKEFDILAYLIKNEGRILTRQMIMDHVWSQETSSWISTVDVHIKHLRDKIDRPFANPYIKTAYGIGYKIEAR